MKVDIKVRDFDYPLAYPIEETKPKKLVHSVIPREEVVQVRLTLDVETDRFIAQQAFKHGMHVQEAYRRILWNWFHHMDIPLDQLGVKIGD